MQFRSVLHRLTLHAQTSSGNADPSKFTRVLRPFLHLAAELTTAWYDSQPHGDPGFVPEPHDDVPDERLERSLEWAQTQLSPADRLRGITARAVYDASRNTVVFNVDREPGARWAREARPDACSFCKVLASRGAKYHRAQSALSVTGASTKLTPADLRAIGEGRLTRDEALDQRMVYRSKTAADRAGKKVGDYIDGTLQGSRERGASYHDDCHCIAVMVRPGDTYIPPAYADGWHLDYTRAIDDAKKHIGGRPAFKDILNAMDRAQRAANH